MMRGMILIACLLANVTASSWAALDAKELGAKADGVTDDTAALQAGLDKAGETGDRLYLPPGQYRCDGVLNIPPCVTMEGSYAGPHAGVIEKGTVLFAYSGRDNEAGAPFISLNTSSTLTGVSIFYPEQRADDIHPYPWTIQARGQHYNVMDITLINAFNGVDCGTFHNEGHHLRNVFMCALNKGVLIDQTTDVGRVENVHIHSVYWWRLPAPYALPENGMALIEAYTKAHLTGFTIGRSDWEFMSGCFVIWAKTGYHFVETSGGHASGICNAVITQSGSDIGPEAVRIDKVQTHAGIAFENCQFMSGFNIGPANEGPVKLTNCGFWGEAGAGSQMVLEGTGTVTLTATHFDDWDQQDKSLPCIDARAGSLLMQGCDFRDRDRKGPHIRLAEGMASAVVMGNRFRGGEARVENQIPGEGRARILANVAE